MREVLYAYFCVFIHLMWISFFVKYEYTFRCIFFTYFFNNKYTCLHTLPVRLKYPSNLRMLKNRATFLRLTHYRFF